MVVVRRIRSLVIVLFLVGTVMFFVLHAVPGSPARTILGNQAPAAQVTRLNHALGFSGSLWDQYLSWLWHALQGNFGYSFSQDQGAGAAVASHIMPTLVVAVTITVVSIIVAVPLAVHTIQRPDTALSRVLLVVSSGMMAVPTFWLALVLVVLLAVRVRLFPVSGYVAPTDDLAGFVHYGFLPVVVMVANFVPLLILTLRESLAAEMLQSYARTARAKGATERQVMYRHLLRNAFLPALTVIGSNMGALLGGLIILETIFLIPGLGALLSDGLGNEDYNLILAITITITTITIIVNLCVDLLYSVLDPRVRVTR